MSSSVYVSCHTCGNSLNHGHESLPGGLGPLFGELGLPPLDTWDGTPGLTMLPRLQHAVTELEDDIQNSWYRVRHDTEEDVRTSGWSRVDFALPFLKAMRDGICREPYSTIHRT